MCDSFNHAELSWLELWRLMNDGIPPNGREIERYLQSPPWNNVAPAKSEAVVRILRNKSGELTTDLAHLGLIPNCFKNPLNEWKVDTINAKVETVCESPSYREAYRHGRCVVPMGGYYEWSTRAITKRTYYIRHSKAPALLVAGLCSEVHLPDFEGTTCAILTEPAKGLLSIFHDRQPVLLDRDAARMWLDGKFIEDILRQSVDELIVRRVRGEIGSKRGMGADLIVPMEGVVENFH
jgi:putative SOS response-associated peptidase YedK